MVVDGFTAMLRHACEALMKLQQIVGEKSANCPASGNLGRPVSFRNRRAET